MRIGIMTFHNAINYGAVLQAYALRTYLSRMMPHDDVSIIDYRCKKIADGYRIFAFQRERSFARTLLFNALRLFYVPYNIRNRIHFCNFIQNNLPCVKPKNLDDYDCIVYGSDQIWNQNLTGNDLCYFGAGYSKKKIAYAASDGKSLVISEEIAYLLDSYLAIGCREKSLCVALSQKYPGKSVKTVCDPVFLLGKDEWGKIALPVRKKSFILVYKIGDSDLIDKAAEKLRMETGKKVIQICYRRSLRKWFIKNQNVRTAVHPRVFLGYIQNADLVCTTSFHGTALSIIFEKDFYTFQIPKNEERITCLLEAVGLSERYIDFIPESGGNTLLYSDNVREKFARYREASLQFLKGVLK